VREQQTHSHLEHVERAWPSEQSFPPPSLTRGENEARTCALRHNQVNTRQAANTEIANTQVTWPKRGWQATTHTNSICVWTLADRPMRCAHPSNPALELGNLLTSVTANYVQSTPLAHTLVTGELETSNLELGIGRLCTVQDHNVQTPDQTSQTSSYRLRVEW
jgi:hypothetical protein